MLRLENANISVFGENVKFSELFNNELHRKNRFWQQLYIINLKCYKKGSMMYLIQSSFLVETCVQIVRQ